jgi:RNA polymerase sigma factor (sigma-70 family)
MPHGQLDTVLRHLRGVTGLSAAQELTDGQLLERYVSGHDEDAFATLVRRYDRLVRSVAWRVLHHEQDTDDAFQATFLVFATKAASIRRITSVASWLYGVAYRTAMNAKRARMRRNKEERYRKGSTTLQPVSVAALREIQQILDEEVARLAEKYRAPFVLCCVDGKSKAEAARELGWKEGTLFTRLARARKELQRRLTRRGVMLSAALCAVALARNEAAAAAPSLLDSTIKAALSFAAGKAVASGLASAEAAALAKRVLQSMLMTKVKTAMVVLLAVGFLAGAGFLAREALAAKAADGQAVAPPSPPDQKAATARPDERQEKAAQGDADLLPSGAVVRLGSARLRPAGVVQQLAFSPDGTKLASWSSELYVTDALSVWDARTGRLLRRVDLPGARLQALTWLPDGRGIAVLYAEDPGWAPIVWEFTDVKHVPQLPARGPGPRIAGAGATDPCYAISPDGKTLAMGRPAPDDTGSPILLRPLKVGVAVNDLPAAKELARQPGGCAALLFTPDGERLIAFSAAKQPAAGQSQASQLVVVWDVADGKEVVRFNAPRPPSNGYSSNVQELYRPAAAVSAGALAIGLEDGGTSLWDLATGKERKLATDHVRKKPGPGFGPYASGTFVLAFAPDAKTLLTGGRDGLVKRWAVDSGERLRPLDGHYSFVYALALSPDGRRVASAGEDGLIRLWDATTGADACPQPGHLLTITHAVLSPDGRTAVTAGWDNTLRWWDSSVGRELRKVDLPVAVSGLAISPDGRTVLAGVQEDRLRTWDLATGRETTPVELPPGVKIGALSFTPDGRRLIVASGPRVSLLDWPGMKLQRTFELPRPAKQPGETSCRSVTVSPDGHWLVTVAVRYVSGSDYEADGVVDVWDLTTGEHTRRLAEAQFVFGSATFTADGRVVLVGGGETMPGTIPAEGGLPAEEFKGEMALLDPVAARWVRSFTNVPLPPGVTSRSPGTAVLSPDGRTLYMPYSTGQIIGFEVATGQPRRTLSGHHGWVAALGISPDGRRLISGGHDMAALVWDLTLAGAAQARKEPRAAAAANELWATAAESEAGVAFAAMADLAAVPGPAIEVLRRHVKPVPDAPTDADLDRLFADLDSDLFATRDQASRELARLGESAVPGVRNRLHKAESVEVRRRARAFLDQFDQAEQSPDHLRQLRAVELLEGIGTPAAKQYLTELAKGAAGAPLTRDAAAALGRLERR